MQESKDEWHSLNTLIALAVIHYATQDHNNTIKYLDKAKDMAERIKSPEHMAEINALYYKHYKFHGEYKKALDFYEQSTAMQDSVLDMEKVNRIQNASLNIERHRQAKLMNEAELKLQKERSLRQVGFAIFTLLMTLLLGLGLMQMYVHRLRTKSHKALKQMAALRENFFTNITHEFRTPLTVILGMSNDLKKLTDCQPVVIEKAQTIERQGQGLLTLINQLLDISKVKSATGNPDWKNGNITTHLTMIVDSYRDYAQSRNIELNFLSKGAVDMDFVPGYINQGDEQPYFKCI